MKRLIRIIFIAIFIFGLIGCELEDVRDALNDIQEVVNDIDENVSENTNVDEVDNTNDNNSSSEANDNSTPAENSNEVDESIAFDGYTLIEVDGGDLSGHREPNVVVDVGFGTREYYI